jgi:biotin carboxyl carrier protein
MKSVVASVLALVLLFSASALAAQDLTGRPVADGVVAAAAFADVTAPYGGTLASFVWESGDAVAAGDLLASYVQPAVYAPEAGTVRGVFVAEGDDAAAAVARYGQIMGIEPDIGYRVSATTSGAYNEDANKVLHLGELLYFRTGTGGNASEGMGRVVAVSGQSYQVDVLTGQFDLDASVTLYRRDNYEAKSAVGKGTVARRPAVLITATGRVGALAVSEGAHVAAGDLLLTLAGADAAPDAYAPQVLSPAAGVVERVYVTPGQQVYKGAALFRLSLDGAMEVRAEVDETDMGALKVGDLVPITLDTDKQNVLIGTVTQISGLGVSKQNAAYFAVRATIPQGSGRLGASASMYLPVKDSTAQ